MRRYLLIGVGIALVATFLTCAYAAECAYAQAFFVAALRNADVHELVEIGAVEYTVSDGVVYQNGSAYAGAEEYAALRLAYEEASARRDPPFSLAGTDPSALLAAITQAQKTQLALASIQSTSSQASLVSSSLYPLDFLTAAAKLEDARRQFLESGTQKDATTYEEQITATASLYQEDLSNFRSAFQQAVPADVGAYVSAHDTISRSGTLEALQSLSKDGSDISQQLERQTWCLAGLVQECVPSQIALPVLPEETASPLTAAQLDQAVQVRALYAGAGISLGTTTQLSSSSCLSGEAPALVGIYGSSELMWLDDVRFVRSDEELAVPFFQQLSQKGIAFVSIPPFLYYECPNLGSDWGAFSATVAVAQFALNTPLSAYTSGAEASTLKSLERSLASPLLAQQDANAYLRTGESLAAAGKLPPAIENEVISLAVSMKDGGADFDVLVSEVARTEQVNTDLAQEGVAVDLSADYLFFVRNAFAPFFFADNASVNPAGDLFPADTVPQNEQPYVLYSTLPHTSAMDATLQKDIGAYYQLHGLKSP